MDGAAGRLGLAENALRFAEQVRLAQALADIDAARGEEGVGHAAPDDQVGDLADQMAKDRELGRYLGATDYRRHRPLRITKYLLQGAELRFHRSPRISRQEGPDPLGRSMGAVRNRKGVVDVIVAERRHAFRQFRVVLLLAGMEAGVFEDAYRSGQHDRHGTLGLWARAILDEAHRPPGELSQRLCHEGRP